MDETGFLVLLAVHEGLARAPGSKVIVAACGHLAFISPTGQRHYRGEGAGLYAVCSDCVDVKDVIASETEEKRLVPGALDEVQEWLGKPERTEAEEWAKRMGFRL
jgi:hypothetical protein